MLARMIPMLKRVFRSFSVVSFLIATSLAAESPFVGDWKLNPSKSKIIDQMKVESAGANKYTFDFGGAKEMIVIDGTDQPGYGGTTLSVAAEPPGAWTVVRKKDGHLMLTATWNLSKDGKTLTDNYTEFDPKGSPVTVKYVYKRTAKGSGFAGTWEGAIAPINSDYVIQVRAWEGDGLSVIDPSGGITKNVKFDGKDYPHQGPNGNPGSTSSMRRLNERTLEMEDKTNGTMVSTRRIGLSSDRKTLAITVRVAGRAEPNVLIFERR